MATTKATAIPSLTRISGSERAAAVELVRSCRKGERCEVFGVEVECLRRGWFRTVSHGAPSHEMRSAGIVAFIGNMASMRRRALQERMDEAADAIDPSVLALAAQ